MKKSGNIIIKAAGMILIMTIICGILYTAMITGISQLVFEKQANGSIIEINGKKYGSELLAQKYTDESHMWGRAMNLTSYEDKDGVLKMYAAPSNLSPKSDALKNMVDQRVEMIRKVNPKADVEQIPVELVTVSGSGLDPEISLAAAQYQVPRIAQENGMSKEMVEEMVEKCTNHKILGFLGEETVNVLKVNLMLDGIME